MQFAGKDELWRSALLAFFADNLAHELGGFKESFLLLADFVSHA